MKLFFFLLLLLVTDFAGAQTPAPAPGKVKKEERLSKADTVSAPYLKGITLATFSVGFSDYYRRNITLPAGFQQNNTSGFLPVYGRLEYGVSHTVSIAACFSYDAVYDNFYQLYPGYNTVFKVYNTDKINIFRAGVVAYYHFAKVIKVKNLDVFAGCGFSLNRVHYSGSPQGDSTAVLTEHTVSPSLKGGGRYYFKGRGSIFAEAGYDRQSVFDVGYSCRFFKK